MWIVLLVVIGVLVYFLMESAESKRTTDTSHETPLEVLKKRYARGEITREEFEEMKRSL